MRLESSGVCDFCEGTGFVGNAARWYTLNEPEKAPCPRCGGSGHVRMPTNDEERMSPDSPEGRAEYAYKRATPAERRAVLGEPCEHLNTEDFVCLDCGSPVPPYDLDDAQEGRW